MALVDGPSMSANGFEVEALLEALASSDGEREHVLGAFYEELVEMVPGASGSDQLTLAGIAVSVHTALQFERHERWTLQEAERHKSVMRDIEARLEKLEGLSEENG